MRVWYLTEVEPVSWRTSHGFIDGEWASVQTPEYPDSPLGRKLREARTENQWPLQRAAHRLGLAALELSGLETGRYTLPDAQWAAMLEQVRGWGKNGGAA